VVVVKASLFFKTGAKVEKNALEKPFEKSLYFSAAKAG
jgi:hypothetical protein